MEKPSRTRDSHGRLQPKKCSYEGLLAYPEVQTWIKMYRSPNTRRSYMRLLEAVTRKTGLKPTDILALPLDQARRKIMDVVKDYLDMDKTAMAKHIQTAMKMFFEANDEELKFKKTEKVRMYQKKIHIEVIPKKEQVYRMVDTLAGEPRNQAIILCLFQSGVRIGCLVNWTFSMVKDQLYQDITIPVRLRITNQIDTKLGGYGLGYYYAFLQREAAEALRAYLDERIRNEGGLKPEAPIFVPTAGRGYKEKADPRNIIETVKRAAKSIGLDPRSVWTHTLRKSFRKVLNTSDIDEDTKEAIQGHKLPGSRQNYFDVHDIDEIAAKYMKADFSRAIVTVSEDAKKDMLLSMWRDQARMYGIDPMKIRVEKATVDQEIEAIQSEIKKLVPHPFKAKNPEQKVIHERDLEEHLAKGWRFTSALNNGSGKVIVEKPS